MTTARPRTARTPRKPPAGPSPTAAAAGVADKDRPLVDDIRLLGRILGDVIREQEGDAAFDLVERVRQLAVAYRIKRDARAGRALDRLLKGLSGDQTVSVIRAFSYFSHLANIAEDRHHVRRRSTTSARAACSKARWRWRSSASPAAASRRTASPRRSRTPGSRRCSPRIRPRCSARASSMPSARSPRLVEERDRLGAREPGAQRRAAAGPRHPALADADAAHDQARRSPTRSRTRSATTARPSWRRCRASTEEIEEALPGLRDRELLPHGQLDRRRPRRQSLRHRRDAAHGLRAPERDRAALLPHRAARARRRALDLGDALRGDAASCWHSPARAGDRNVHRDDEPYRRALIGMYARLAATLHALTGTEALRHAVAPARRLR